MNPRNTWILVALAAALFGFIYLFERHWGQAVVVDRHVLPHFDAAAVTSVQVQPGGQFEIRADLTNGSWQVTKPLNFPAQSLAIEALLRSLQDLTYETYISAGELRDRPNANQDFGFESPLFTIILNQGSELHQLKIGRPTPPGDGFYVQVIGADGVDIVGADLLKSVPREPNNWRDTTFVRLKSMAFDQLNVTNGDQVFELQRDPTNKLWRMTRPDQARADTPKIDELLFQLQNLRVNRFITDDPKADLESFGLQPPHWQLALGQGTNTVALLQFGKGPANDDTQVYARCAGQDSVVLLPREPLEAWRAEHEKFRDPHLAGLSSGTLDEISVAIPGKEGFTVRQTNGVWFITKPKTLLADAGRMRDFIDALGNLEVTPYEGKFAVKQLVLESDYPSYGLAPPARKYILKRSMTNAAGIPTDAVVELDFGSQKDDKIFARRADESPVYAVKAADFQRLPSSSLDLLERRIWNFTENDVLRIIIRQDGMKQELQHGGTNIWHPRMSTTNIYSSFAVEMAAGELGALQAESWVALGAKDISTYGFSDKSPQISVELFGQDKPQLLTLQLGGWSADKRRFGAIQWDGQNWVFEVPQTLLDRVLPYLNIRDNATR